jgi:hypothetical protein
MVTIGSRTPSKDTIVTTHMWYTTHMPRTRINTPGLPPNITGINN